MGRGEGKGSSRVTMHLLVTSRETRQRMENVRACMFLVVVVEALVARETGDVKVLLVSWGMLGR